MAEEGWSAAPSHKLWRFLARTIPIGRSALLGPHAVASVTFDDVPASAVENGAPVLERRGCLGTFYVAAELCGKQQRHWRVAERAQILRLAEARHEIGCHTARHVNVQSLSVAELRRECDRSRDLLVDLCGVVPQNFCYPFGSPGLFQKWHLAARFATCRSIYEKLNAGRVDPAVLGAFGLFDATFDRSRLIALVEAAKARRGWLIFYTHDIEDDPTPIGASPRLLDEVLAVLCDHGVPVLTVEAAARFHGLTNPFPADPASGVDGAEAARPER